MYFIKELDNGIKVIIQKIENINSISLGLIIENGSTNEDNNNNGISHFIEHLLFRGTLKKSSKDISRIIDEIGGNVNAFTSKENTCFYAQVLKQHLDIIINLFSDMFLNPLFDELDIEKEKKVIEEEISMYQDDPEDLVHELLNELIYKDTSLSLPILGKIDSINRFNKNILYDYYKKNYTGNKIIISLTGNVDVDETYKKINDQFGQIRRNKSIDYNKKTEIAKISTDRINNLNKDIEQLNLCIGLPGPSSSSDNIYSYSILNNIIANNESSRLYESIREEGLAYSIYSNMSTYNEIGDLSIYMGLNNDEIEKILDIIDDEFNLINKHYISLEELKIGKEQLKINYILDTESSIFKMFENAKYISLFDRIKTQEEILKSIDKINKNDIVEIINKTFKRDLMKISYIEKIDNKKMLKKLINKKIFRGV